MRFIIHCILSLIITKILCRNSTISLLQTTEDNMPIQSPTESGYLSKIHHHDIEPKDITEHVKGIIFSGGPNSVYAEGSPQIDPAILEAKVPILGICYGHQLICHKLGGKVIPGKNGEYGKAHINYTDNQCPLYEGIPSGGQVWMSHGDHVSDLPEGFEVTASSDMCSVVSVQSPDKMRFGLQYHPEVVHSKIGMEILKNFCEKICKLPQNWHTSDFMKQIEQDIKTQVKNRKVFMLVSGGVDSTVAFAILNKLSFQYRALGSDNCFGLYIDNGLLRHNEYEEVQTLLTKCGFKNFKAYDARKIFLEKLKNAYLPEEKRKIIGDTFIEVQRQALQELHLNEDEFMLGQGTIYPDTIESKGTKNSHLIKTHHNRVEIIQKMIEAGKVIEPLQNLYKDEVRSLGMELGLPKQFVNRHPFPGPGLGVRCLCVEDTQEDVSQIQISPQIQKEMEALHLNYTILPVKSVGVQGDQRTYKHPILLHTTFENIKKIGWNTFNLLSGRITNASQDVNRVLLLVSGESFQPDKHTLQKKYIMEERLTLLKQADYMGMQTLQDNDLMEVVWQMPTILIPYGSKNNETVILRPISSQEAMTAEFTQIDMNVIFDLASRIKSLDGVEEVYFDLTNKPPGTIEWE